MGQKVNPIGYRIGVNKQCDSTWFATKGDYINNLHEDLKIKKYIKSRLKEAMISKVQIHEKPNLSRLIFILPVPVRSSAEKVLRSKN